MLDGEFYGVMTKHTHAFIDNEVFVKIGIKHTNVGDVQSFLSSIEDKLNIKNIKPLFAYPVRWKKLVIDTSDYEKNTFDVSFDEITFQATLNDIQISRKTKDGTDIFEYTLNFRKEVGVDNEDSVTAKTYLKYKEENEDGKMVIKEFPVELTLLNVVKKVTPDADLF